MLEKLTFKQLLILISICVGGICAISSPEHMDDAMSNTIWAILLIAFVTD